MQIQAVRPFAAALAAMLAVPFASAQEQQAEKAQPAPPQAAAKKGILH